MKEFQKLLGDESDDEYSEPGSEAEEIHILEVSNPIDSVIAEGDFAVTGFPVGQTMVYYVSKIMEVVEGEGMRNYVVNSLRRMAKTDKFYFLDNPDISTVCEDQLRYKLPAPMGYGQTKRQQNILKFDVLIPSEIDLR